jgi:hypothetical protein
LSLNVNLSFRPDLAVVVSETGFLSISEFLVQNGAVESAHGQRLSLGLRDGGAGHLDVWKMKVETSPHANGGARYVEEFRDLTFRATGGIGDFNDA